MRTLELLEAQTRTLRTWFVAFGIGAPVLVLTNEALYEIILSSGKLRLIGKLFLLGVACQIGLAALNKSVVLVQYYGEEYKTFQQSRRHQMADWLSNQIWIDLGLDLLTIVLFAVATFYV